MEKRRSFMCLPIIIRDVCVYICLVLHARKIKQQKVRGAGVKGRKRLYLRAKCEGWKICVICLMESFALSLYCKNVTNITQISFPCCKFLLNVCLIFISSDFLFIFWCLSFVADEKMEAFVCGKCELKLHKKILNFFYFWIL